MLTTNDVSHPMYNEMDWATEANDSQETKKISRKISLDGITGENTYFAFRYNATGNAQRKWHITDFIIEANLLQDNRTLNIVEESFMNLNNVVVVNVAGKQKWELGKSKNDDSGTVFMGIDKKGEDNEDWLIMPPLDLSTNEYPTSPDKGVEIKKIEESNKTFEYFYETPGEYLVSILVNHWDFENNELTSQVFEQTITVVE
ncbi:hypothetical protein VOI54_17430 [Tamlana sp. 2201CG12-4]|uniref:hypothetical protein n=1 Tax=Tamlana sp. 2201CG12-4 TaxID=3112582 RepID=UPI002DBDBDE3|nr:hypothetical protein [Tamlana sp. 2201CG12-4]MEC3908813.1 hypothetical protein [Tamlana sp. 2201CG12-4]